MWRSKKSDMPKLVNRKVFLLTYKVVQFINIVTVPKVDLTRSINSSSMIIKSPTHIFLT